MERVDAKNLTHHQIASEYLIEVGQATGMLEGIFADQPASPG